MNLFNPTFNDNTQDNRIKQLEKQVEELKQSRNDYKKKWEKAKRRYDRDKAFFSTMQRHNNRLQNDNDSTHAVLEQFRAIIKELCPHKQEWIKPDEVVWGSQIRYNCTKCHEFILGEEINREI